MVGQPFLDAVRKAAFAYREMSAAGNANVIDPRAAWKVYEPATLPKPEQPATVIDAADAKKRFENTAAALLDLRMKAQQVDIKAAMDVDGESAYLWNQKGIVEAQHGKSAEAEKSFRRALELDAANPAALNNLGNLAYEDGRYADALANYRKAAAADPEDGGLWLNVTRALMKLGKGDEAKESAQTAKNLDAGLKEQLEALMKL